MTPPFIIRTPCCGAEVEFDYENVSTVSYSPLDRVSGMWCTGKNCSNYWDRFGNPTW